MEALRKDLLNDPVVTFVLSINFPMIMVNRRTPVRYDGLEFLQLGCSEGETGDFGSPKLLRQTCSHGECR